MIKQLEAILSLSECHSIVSANHYTQISIIILLILFYNLIKTCVKYFQYNLFLSSETRRNLTRFSLSIKAVKKNAPLCVFSSEFRANVTKKN